MSVGSITGLSSSTQVFTDPRDLNRDGKVSEAELQTYALAHPTGIQAAQNPASAVNGPQSLLDVTV